MRKMSPEEYKRFREEQIRNREEKHRADTQAAGEKVRDANSVLDTRDPGEGEPMHPKKKKIERLATPEEIERNRRDAEREKATEPLDAYDIDPRPAKDESQVFPPFRTRLGE
jgi:hypothetical protein